MEVVLVSLIAAGVVITMFVVTMYYIHRVSHNSMVTLLNLHLHHSQQSDDGGSEPVGFQ